MVWPRWIKFSLCQFLWLGKQKLFWKSLKEERWRRCNWQKQPFSKAFHIKTNWQNLFWQILQNSEEKNVLQSLFSCPSQIFSNEFCEIFQNRLFSEYLCGSVSGFPFVQSFIITKNSWLEFFMRHFTIPQKMLWRSWTLRKRCPCLKFYWSLFSRIWTKYRYLLANLRI